MGILRNRTMYFCIFNNAEYNLFFICDESKAGDIMVEGVKRGCMVQETTSHYIHTFAKNEENAMVFTVEFDSREPINSYFDIARQRFGVRFKARRHN